jgi:hypothetical protein
MRKSKLLILSLLSVLGIGAVVVAPDAWSGNSRPAQLAVQVIRRPDPMVAYGKAYLVYELLLTNYDASSIELQSLRIADPDDKKISFRFSSKQLRRMMAPVGRSEQKKNVTTIESGASRLVFVWLEFDGADEVPRRLAHFLRYRVKRDTTIEGEIATPPVTVDDAPSLTIGPPLEGGNWLVNGGPANTSYHRRAHMAIDGVVYFAQRFAIDYEKIGPDGRTYSGDPKKSRSYHCYGADVIAVADGRVVAVRDGVPENVPDPVKRAVKMTLDTAAGNHLIPGSLKVKQGDFVKRGQVLARLGNSGNSTEPHLHFQIADAPSFLAANGLPYLYDRVSIRPSRVVDANVDPPVVRVTGAAREYFSTLLLENEVVVFAQ